MHFITRLGDDHAHVIVVSFNGILKTIATTKNMHIYFVFDPYSQFLNLQFLNSFNSFLKFFNHTQCNVSWLSYV